MTNRTDYQRTTEAHTETAAKRREDKPSVLTAEQRAQGKQLLLTAVRCLVPFLLALLFSRAHMLYGTQPLGIAFLCALGGSGVLPFLSAAAGVGLSWATGVYGEAGGLYIGAFLLAVGIRYAVGRFLGRRGGDTQIRAVHPGFGAAKGRGRRYAEGGVLPDDADAPIQTDVGADTRCQRWMRALRWVFPEAVFYADMGMKLGIAVLAATPIAAGLLLTADTAVRGTMAAATVLCAIPAFAYLFSGVADGAASTPGQREAGIAALCFALTAAGGGMLVFGFSVKMLVCHALTLFCAQKSGYLRGALCGLVAGFACDALYAPAYALIGATYGILKVFFLAPAVILSLCAGAAYAIYVGEFAAIRAVVPEMIAVSAVAYPLLRYFPSLLQKNKAFRTAAAWVTQRISPYLCPDEVSRTAEPATDLPRETVTPQELGIPGPAQQLDALSGILSGLSTTFYHLSDRWKKPGLFEVRAMCEGIAEGYCTGCEKRAVCWEEDFSRTADAMGRITLSIYRRGRAGTGTQGGKHGDTMDAFAPLDRACAHLPAMLAEMNDAVATLCAEKLRNDKTEVAAGDYEGMAKLLRASAEETAKAGARDDALSRRLTRVMQKLGFSAEDVSVYGERRRTVVARGIRLGRGTASPPQTLPMLGGEEVREAFSAVVGVRYRAPAYAIGNGGNGISMTLQAEPKLGVKSGCWGEKKAGEEITGDVLTVFSNRADYYYALLCDGMGSGREASVTAQISSLFLEKMLSVSCAKGAALNLLNSYLRARNSECSATVDLCEIDMITGDAHFVKCGAAATYLLREDSMFRIASATAPLGILREVSSEETAFSLCDGDTLLFFSDGVCGECEDGAWIPAVLARAKEDYDRALVKERTRARCAGTNDAGTGTDAEIGAAGTAVREALPARCDYLARALGEEAKQRVGRADDMTVIYLEVHFLEST